LVNNHRTWSKRIRGRANHVEERMRIRIRALEIDERPMGTIFGNTLKKKNGGEGEDIWE